MLDKLEEIMKSNPVKVLMALDESIRQVEQRIMLIDNLVNNIDSMILGKREVIDHRTTVEVTREEEDDFLSHLMKGIREIELAKMKVGCPTMQSIIDEILLFAEEKLEDMKWSTKDIVKAAEDVLREEGVDDWSSLSDAEKTLIKEKIKSRLRNSG